MVKSCKVRNYRMVEKIMRTQSWGHTIIIKCLTIPIDHWWGRGRRESRSLVEISVDGITRCWVSGSSEEFIRSAPDHYVLMGDEIEAI